MLIVQSQSTDVYRNLAVEEWLLDHAEGRGPILFLCVNAPCVVIGKNQNPWRECRLSLMEKEGVPLARRISGGGAVYHDEGNLNVGVIVPRTEYREEKQYELIFQTLEEFGVKASKLRKNSLAVDGKKFSGQAFSFRGQHVLHHGTLLVNSDLNRLGRYLGSEIEGIETKAVASVPADVANLSTFAPELTVEKISAALIETFREMYGRNVGQASCLSEQAGSLSYVEKNITEVELLSIIEKLSSNDWKLCHTPYFQVTISGQTLDVEKGRITNLEGSPPFGEWGRSR
ncbi:MAG: lipoate--protein ligase family protein [Kiritimatiellaceae bacterium]|nr:lipoate--protein ligase family protein [Kiritimatiellaceae bacterium]